MSIICKMHIEEKVYNILNYNWRFDQKADVSGRPIGKAMGGIIHIEIETTKDTVFTEWAVHDTMMKYVKIIQSSVLLNGRSRKLEFYDAVCLSITDDFNSTGNEPMKTHLTISSPLIVVDGIPIMEKYWKVTELSESNGTTEVTTLSNKPDFVGYYIIDSNNERIKEYDVGDIIKLNIETEYCSGKSITINLQDKTHDFKLNGIPLKNDVLRNYIISNDLEQIELEVIEPQK